MKKIYAIANFLSVILVLVINGLSQTQRWNNTTVGEISNKFGNLFTEFMKKHGSKWFTILGLSIILIFIIIILIIKFYA